jgi:phosphate-selective porin OprO/OprP
MLRIPAALGLVTLILVLCAPAVPAPAGEMVVQWKDGLRFDEKDGEVSIKIGGRFMNDWAWFPEGDEVQVDTADGTEFRRARIAISGDFASGLYFKHQVDWSGGDMSLKDIYMGLKGLGPVDRIQVGHQKEPYSLEALASSNYISLMERSPVAVFDSERNTGIQAFRGISDQRALLAVGVFRNTDNQGTSTGDGQYAFSGRLSGLPWLDAEKARHLHLGVSGSYRVTDGEARTYGVRPSSHLTSRILATEEVAARHQTLGGAEASLALGSFSVDAEYKLLRLEDAAMDEPTLSGGYVMVSWLATGEHRPYKRSGGVYDRIRPRRPFGQGPGAWELVARFTRADLSEAGGGELDDYAVGVNWYLNNNARIMVNYVYSDAGEAGDFQALQTRFAVYY